MNNVIITSIKAPEQGWPIVTHCSLCGVTRIVHSPYAQKPEKGDYWVLEGFCPILAHSLSFPNKKFGV
jgi:hypothetical protein